MKNWFDNIVSHFERIELKIQLPFQSPFHGIWLTEQHVCFHFVSLKAQVLNQCQPLFFMQCSQISEQQNIKCIHIWEDVFKRNPTLVIDRLSAIIGRRKRIHARQTIVQRIQKYESEQFLNHNHLQGNASAYYKYGLYFKNELVAVATFSKSRVMNDGVVPYRSYEWVRFTSKSGTTVIGGLSKLLNHFIKEVNPAHIMTYADRDWGDGIGYTKLGFKAIEEMEPQPFLIDLKTLQRIYFKNKHEVNVQYIEVYNSGNIKYVFDRRT